MFIKSILFILIVLTAANAADAAILNSLRGFSNSEPGWSGNLGGSFARQGGNSETGKFSAAARLQYNRESQTVKILTDASRSSSNNVESSRSMKAHLRHNLDLGNGYKSLLFLQIQENPFQRLESRFLAGIGARKDFAKKFSLGLSTMWERERTEDSNEARNLHRASSFLSSQYEIRDGLFIDALAFYQPLWNDFSDWRGFLQAQLNVDLSDRLQFFSGVEVEHDSNPPADVEETDWKTSTGFSFKI